MLADFGILGLVTKTLRLLCILPTWASWAVGFSPFCLSCFLYICNLHAKLN
nr:hypothetical protein Itr_chr05CG07140 [Ipomoea trifida]